MRRPATMLFATLAWLTATGGLAPGCHRRRPTSGACVAHIDCAPGYDCIARRCTKRPPIPGSTPTPDPAATPVVAPPSRTLSAPPDDQPPPAAAPPLPRAPESAPPPPDLPSPPPTHLPMWKERLKNS